MIKTLYDFDITERNIKSDIDYITANIQKHLDNSGIDCIPLFIFARLSNSHSCRIISILTDMLKDAGAFNIRVIDTDDMGHIGEGENNTVFGDVSYHLRKHDLTPPYIFTYVVGSSNSKWKPTHDLVRIDIEKDIASIFASLYTSSKLDMNIVKELIKVGFIDTRYAIVTSNKTIARLSKYNLYGMRIKELANLLCVDSELFLSSRVAAIFINALVIIFNKRGNIHVRDINLLVNGIGEDVSTINFTTLCVYLGFNISIFDINNTNEELITKFNALEYDAIVNFNTEFKGFLKYENAMNIAQEDCSNSDRKFLLRALCFVKILEARVANIIETKNKIPGNNIKLLPKESKGERINENI